MVISKDSGDIFRDIRPLLRLLFMHHFLAIISAIILRRLLPHGAAISLYALSFYFCSDGATSQQITIYHLHVLGVGLSYTRSY